MIWTDVKAALIDAAASDIKAKTDALPADPASESGAIKTETAAIKAKTDPLPADPASESGAIKTETAAIKTETAAIKTTTDTNLDAKVSERATPAQILADPATDLIDGSALDASVASRSSHAPADILKDAAKKMDGERIDSLLAGIVPIEGTCEPAILDTITEVVKQELGVLFYLEGHIDLSVMEAGDAITLSESISIVTPVDYKKYADSDYSGVQALPLLYVETKPGRYGVKVELTQTAGVVRVFPYQFFVKRVV
uniref:Uncharacterized protein n=1 Tax=viral metagenome TaxID=1070528 RepID=A0A6M3LXN2_9ZZZZ